MQKEILEKQIEEQLKKFENAVELPFNAELGEQMQYVRDGILNVEAYLSAPVKILYILKDVNSRGNDLSDMRKDLVKLNEKDKNRIDDGWGATWRPIAYATYGIFENMNFQEIRDNIGDINGNADEILKHIPKIAHLNVKKIAGVETANDTEIQNFYNQYKDLLHEQIELINPDVLIFCGTFNYFDAFYFAEKEEVVEKIYKYKDKLLIDTRHPNRAAYQTYCDFIINAVRNWTHKKQY
jgi:hypothetical protein